MSKEGILDILSSLGNVLKKERNLDDLLVALGESAQKIVGGDRASIFVYDPVSDELWTRVASGIDNTIRIPAKKGVAGSSLKNKETVIVQDAYNNPLFFQDVDKITGYKTKSVLAVPMINMQKQVIGVFQILNKKIGIFTKKDASKIIFFADYASKVLENALFYENMRRKYEDKKLLLEKSEETLEVIAFFANDGIWEWDLGTKNIYFSQRFYEILHFEVDDLEPSQGNFFALVHPHDLKKVKGLFDECFDNKTPLKVECRIRTKSGDYLWALLRGHPLYRQSKLVRIVGTITDITDAKAKEKELQDALIKIECLLKDQNEFIHKTVHDINTPVSVINAYLGAMNDNCKKDEHIPHILAATKTLSTIYDDFQYIINKDKYKYEPQKLNISEFIQERLIYFNDIAMAKNQSIVSKIENDLYVKLNKIELMRIVDNVISNAIKFNKEGLHVFVGLKQTRDKITFSVKDQGCGIKDTLGVFSKYTQEDPNKGGFGIGLNVVKEICDKRHIKVKITSTKKYATIFECVMRKYQ